MHAKRKFSRAAVSIKAEIEYQGKKTVGQVTDLSLHGALIQAQTQWKLGEKLAVSFELPGKPSEPPLKLEGVVARITPDGAAVNFEQVDLDAFVHLRDIVTHHTGNADQFDEELMNYIKEKESFVVHKKCET